MKITDLADDDLLSTTLALARQSSAVTAELVAHLAEVDRRRLYVPLGHSSMFAYCVERLGLSEGGAYNRIEAARAARRFPVVLDLLSAGRLTLTNARLLAPHLTDENHREVLEEACGLPRSGVERIVARLQPQPAAPSSLRRLPAPRGTAPAAPVQPVLEVKPLAAQLYRLTVTLDEATFDEWQRAKKLLGGDDATVLTRVLETALKELERLTARRERKTAPHSRHIPDVLRRRVAQRDGYQCTFVGRDGRRCTQRRYLQCHHVKPWSAGGETTLDNLQLRCGVHNRHEADVFFAAARARFETSSS